MRRPYFTRLKVLGRIPAKIRFVSVEPLLGRARLPGTARGLRPSGRLPRRSRGPTSRLPRRRRRSRPAGRESMMHGQMDYMFIEKCPGLTVHLRVQPSDEPVAVQDRHHVVSILATALRHVNLDREVESHMTWADKMKYAMWRVSPLDGLKFIAGMHRQLSFGPEVVDLSPLQDDLVEEFADQIVERRKQHRAGRPVVVEIFQERDVVPVDVPIAPPGFRVILDLRSNYQPLLRRLFGRKSRS